MERELNKQRVVEMILLLSIICITSKPAYSSKLDSLARVWHDTTLSDTSRLKAMWIYSNKRWLKCTHDSLFLTGVQMYNLADRSGNMFYKSFGLRNQVWAKLYKRDYDSCEILLIKKNVIDSLRGNKWWMATNYNILAELSMFKYDYKRCNYFLDRSYAIWEDFNYKSKKAFILNFKGLVSQRLGDYKNAIKLFRMASDTARIDGNTDDAAIYQMNIGIILGNQGKYDSALTIIFKALDSLDEKKRKSWEAHSGYYIGEILSRQGKYTEALGQYENNINSALKRHMPDQAAKTKIMIGNDCLKQGEIGEALEIFNECLDIFLEIGIPENIALAYGRFGYLHFLLENYPKALEYYQRSIEITTNTQLKEPLADIYFQVGEVYLKTEDFPRAGLHFQKSLDLNLEMGRKNKIADAYNAFGLLYFAEDNLDQAEVYFNYAMNIRNEIGDQRGLAENYIELAEVHFLKNDLATGMSWCKKGYDLSTELKLRELEMKAAKCLYKANKELGNNSTALQYYERYNTLEDTLSIDEAVRKLQMVEFKRERTEDSLAMMEAALKAELAYEKNLASEKTKRNTFMFSGIGVLILAIALLSRVYFIRKANKRLEEKNKIIEQEKQRAEASERAKEQFFNNVSHEFRTPLTLILGPLEESIQKNSNARIRKNLEIVKRNSARLEKMINELLDLSKLEYGKEKLQARQYEIVKITHDFANNYESLAEFRNVELAFNSDSDACKIWIDLEKFHKILANLISNAFKFSYEGGIVEVNVNTQTPEKVLITVSDKGVGIEEAELPYVFDRFYQGAEKENVHRPGTGIGLALTRELVELHGGTITVESERGQGSVFTVAFLLGREHLKDDQIVNEAIQIEPTSLIPDDKLVLRNGFEHAVSSGMDDEPPKPEVLIVEDNPDMRAYIRGILEKDFVIHEAEDGYEGLEYATSSLPDLIISDVMMPRMNGYELAEKLRKDHRTSHIPLIMLTARAALESKIQGLESGADAYLKKPFNAWELSVRVKQLIEKRSKLREYYNQSLSKNEEEKAVDQLESLDQKFMNKARQLVLKHLDNPRLGTTEFAREMALSRIQLHRKLKALTSKTTTEYIRMVRLNQAAHLLRHRTDSVTQIAYQTGFKSLSWFAKSFKKQFGYTPSEYQEINEL